MRRSDPVSEAKLIRAEGNWGVLPRLVLAFSRFSPAGSTD